MANRSIVEVAENILKPYIDAKDKAYAANIAPVETSPATSGHLTGTQIIYNGVLYDVIADIDATDALVVGTNIAAADDVSEQISDVKQALDNLTATVSDNEPYILRQGKGNMVDLDLVGGSLGWNQLVNTSDTSVTVPSGHKYIGYIGGTLAKATSDGTAISVTGGTDKVFDITQMFGTTVADALTADQFAQYFPNYASASYDAGSLQHVNPSGRKVVGFNVWDELWELGSIDIDTGAETSSTNMIRSKNYYPCLANTEYYMTVLSAQPVGLRLYDGNKSYIGYISSTNATNKAFTMPNNCSYFRLAGTSSYGVIYKNDICVNISKTTGSPKNGDYVPYEQTVANIPKVPLYGIPQLVNNKLAFNGDIRKADGSVTRKYDLKELSHFNYSKGTVGDGVLFYTDPIAYIKPVAVSSDKGNIISDVFITESFADVNAGRVQGISIGTDGRLRIYTESSTYTNLTAAGFKTAMDGHYLVYELATPTTETVAPFQNPQRAFTDGIEEFIYDSGDVPVPVGNESTYYLNDTLPQPLDYAQGVKDILDNKIDSIFKYNSEHNIESNTDLNNMKDIGVYYCTGMAVASTLSNCPVNAAFIMEVRTGNQRGTIVVQDIVYVNSTSLAKYQRSCVSGTWGSWFKFEGTVVS